MDMKETKLSEIYSNLSMLYAQHMQESFFNQKILSSVAKTVHSSLGLEDTLDKYKHFKEIDGSFFLI